jgi:hypothetical protein
VSRDLNRTQLEDCRRRVEQLLNHFTNEAEAWAAAGTRKAGEVVLNTRSMTVPTLNVPGRQSAQRAA